MTPSLPRPAELEAPAGWRQIDLVSDLHLQSGEPATFAAWQRYLAATPADALFILGDLFEVWVGDDAARPGSFEARSAELLHAAAARCALFFLHGNRDFLLGPAFAARCRMRLLDDPTVLAFAGQRWLLSHGDALCLADRDYQRFRAQVRSPAWQQNFLARPLAERQALARAMREQSMASQRGAADYADVDAALARQWLAAADAATLIHGHTHRPAEHALGQGLRRIVLSDWDALAQPPRAQVLRLSTQAPPQRLDLR